MSVHKLTHAAVLRSIQLLPTQDDPTGEGAQPGPGAQRVADAATISKAHQGPLEGAGLSENIYFHRFGRSQTSPSWLYCAQFPGSDTGPPTSPPCASWHRKTWRWHHQGQPGLQSGLHHKDDKSQQQQLRATVAAPLAHAPSGLIQIKWLSLLQEALTHITWCDQETLGDNSPCSSQGDI